MGESSAATGTSFGLARARQRQPRGLGLVTIEWRRHREPMMEKCKIPHKMRNVLLHVYKMQTLQHASRRALRCRQLLRCLHGERAREEDAMCRPNFGGSGWDSEPCAVGILRTGLLDPLLGFFSSF